jgi:hypothetical protein
VQRALNYKLVVMLQLMENGGSGFRNRLTYPYHVKKIKKRDVSTVKINSCQSVDSYTTDVAFW